MRHTPGPEIIGRNDFVGPGRPQRALGGIQDGPGDDEDIRIEFAGQQNHEHIVGIGPDHGHDTPGPVDTGAHEHVLIGGRSQKIENTVLVHHRNTGFVLLDDDHVQVSLGQETRQGPAHAAVAANDIVTFQLIDLFVQFSSPQNKANAPLHQKLDDRTYHVKEVADPQDDEDQGEYSPGDTQGLNFAVAHRRQRDHGHIKRIHEAPAFDQHVPQRTECQQGNGKAHGYNNLCDPLHAAISFVGPIS